MPYESELIEALYVTTDLCLILGLIGFYLAFRSSLFWLGHLGFVIAILGLSFISGPEADFFGVSAYQLGSPVIGVGLLLLSFNFIKAKVCGYIVPASFIASVTFGVISLFVGNSILFIATGVSFGVGFMVLGIHVWRAS